MLVPEIDSAGGGRLMCRRALSLRQNASTGAALPGVGMPASIEDVAKKAKVSISTVSRVINRRELVNVKTRERVEQVIRELRYRPNAFARGLMLRKSGIIGLVLPDLHGEFYSEIIRGANLQAREMGTNLLLSSALPGDDAQRWLAALGQRALLDGLAVMVSDTMAKGIGPALAELQIDRKSTRLNFSHSQISY